MRRVIPVKVKPAFDKHYHRGVVEYKINPPEFPTFCQGDYASTLKLAIRTGIVCPL